MPKLRGIVTRVTYKNAENGYAVLQVQASNGKKVTVTGTFTEISSGASVDSIEFEFTGDWKMTKYGRQFECSASVMMTSDAYYFLTKFTKGIGPKIATQILKLIPEEELANVILKKPEKLLKVKGIGPNRVEKLRASWVEFEHLRKLSEYFSVRKANISNYLVIRIHKHFGDSALEIIDENPYQLTKIKGIGFKTADYLALEIGIERDSKFRMKAALQYILMNEAESNGHTYLKLSKLRSLLAELFDDDVPEKIFEISLQELIDEREISYSAETNLIGLCYLHQIERHVGRFLATPGSKPPVSTKVIDQLIDAAEIEEGVKFADLQREAIKKVTAGETCRFALSGYAGTGKSTVSRTILNTLAQVFCNKDEIVCCAFTGMAAARAREVTGFQAFTIHSLLKFQGGEFFYNRSNKLPYRVIAVDEATMINAKLMSRLTEAVHENTVFILIGDPAQLPPIGPGNIFSDGINRKILDTTTLTQIYRQSEDSVLTYFADFIRRGKVPPEVFKSDWSDFQFIKIEPRNIFLMKKSGATEQELQQARLENNLAILGGILKQATIASTKYDNLLTDFQVLTPMRKGPLGVENLNAELQKILNPASPKKPELRKGEASLRLGDKVVHLMNKDMAVMNAQDWKEKGRFIPAPTFQENTRVFNGSLGIVVDIDHTNETFYVQHVDDRVVEYDFADFLEILEHAFALTVHKAQGSQYKNVVIPISTSHYQMLNSQWLYTAITRAIENTQLIGQPFAFKHACTNTTEKERLTYLSSTPELLQKLSIADTHFSTDFLELQRALVELKTQTNTSVSQIPLKEAENKAESKPESRIECSASKLSRAFSREKIESNQLASSSKVDSEIEKKTLTTNLPKRRKPRRL